MKIDKDLIRRATDFMLTLDEVAFLYSGLICEDWEINLTDTSKKKLRALGFVDRSNNVTPKILDIIHEIEDTRPETTQFEEFFDLYPSSDKFGVWPKTRQIKSSQHRREALIKYNDKVENHAEVMKGLRGYIDTLKKNSLRENKLRFMVNPVRFLDQQIWKDYLEDDQQYNNLPDGELA